MSDGQSQSEGGSAWELSEAIKLMGDAVASGDPEAIATAMRRHSEALTNAANTTMIPTLKSVLESVVKSEIGALTQRMANARQADLDWRVEDRDMRDAQSTRLYAELDGLLSSVQDGTALLGKLDARVGDVETRQGILTDRVVLVSEEISEVKSDVAELRADMANMQIEQGTMRTEQRELRAHVNTKFNEILKHIQKDRQLLDQYREQHGIE